MKSGFLKLSFWDFTKGLIVAILTGIGTYLADKLEADTSITLKKILIASAVAMIAYLIKNLFTNNKDQLLKTDKSV